MEGYVGLMMSGKEMEKYQLKSGPGIKDTLDYQCFSKEFVLQDIQSLGFYSSFHTHRKTIESFPGEEILIFADREEKYGENWVLCVTLESYHQSMERFKKLKEGEENLKKVQLETENQRENDSAVEDSNVVYKNIPILPRKWNSKTMDESHKEVAKLTVTHHRPLIALSITRPRKENGASYKFSDRSADQCFTECRQHKDPNYELTRMEQEVALQGMPELCEKEIQTSWFRAINSSIQYYPIVMTPKKKQECLESEEMFQFLKETLVRVEEALQQNEILDVFMDEFSNLVEDDQALGNKSESNIKELRTFTDLEYSKNKILSAVDWHPKKKGMVAVATTTTLKLDERIENSEKMDLSHILIWNFADLIHPQMKLECPHDTYTFRFNPTQPQLIAAGTSSGQVILWNVAQFEELLARRRNKTISSSQNEEDGDKVLPSVKYEKISHIDCSHRRPITELIWLPAGMEVNNRGKILHVKDSISYQFTTVGGDGQLCFWDVRSRENQIRKGNQSSHGLKNTNKDNLNNLDLIWAPLYKVALTKLEGMGELSLCKFLLDASIYDLQSLEDQGKPPSSTFYCATEEGEMVCADWNPHAINEEEDDYDVTPDYVKWISQDHFRSCVALQRSPFFKDILLSVGDWSYNLWKEGVLEPIFSSPLSNASLTTGRWSPTRPGVLFVAKSDGSMDVWDLMDQSHRHSTSVAIAPTELASMEFWNVNTVKQQLLAVGDGSGNLHILDIPRNLWRPSPNEKNIMEDFFDREFNRVMYIKQRVAVHAVEKEKQEKQDEKYSINKDLAVKVDSPNLMLEKAEEQYRNLETTFRMELAI